MAATPTPPPDPIVNPEEREELENLHRSVQDPVVHGAPGTDGPDPSAETTEEGGDGTDEPDPSPPSASEIADEEGKVCGWPVAEFGDLTLEEEQLNLLAVPGDLVPFRGRLFTVRHLCEQLAWYIENNQQKGGLRPGTARPLR